MRQKQLWFTLFGILSVLAGALMLPAGAVAATKYKVLHRFRGSADGRLPGASLIFDAAGNLYGTTVYGGSATNCEHGCGTVFELTPNSDGTWTEHLLHSFDYTDGYGPAGKLSFDAAGNLYGTTAGGGDFEFGTVFELTPNTDGTWTEHVLHSFAIKESNPVSGLVFDATGNLYGTTAGVGDCSIGCGTVFELTPNSDGTWTEHVLHSFTGGADGANPVAEPTFDTAGNLYGTARAGGTSGYGTVFKLKPNSDGTWTEHVLYTFTGGKDGGIPTGGPIFDTTGNLYGATINGGNLKSCRQHFNRGCGVVFKLIPRSDGSWKESVLHVFGNHPANIGFLFDAGLIFDVVGNLYGTTFYGGLVNGGTVFKLAPNADGSWLYQVLHVFRGNPALHPYGGLVLDNGSRLHGTSSECGSGEGCKGVVFEITP